MDYKSFDEIRNLLRLDLTAFKCIGRPWKKDCGNNLESERKKLAKEVLGEPEADLTGENRRDVLALVLCADCQVNYTEKNNYRSRYSDLDFAKRSPSPHTLYSSSNRLSRRRSSGVRLAVETPRPSAQTRGSNELTLNTIPSSPTEDVLARRRGRSAPSTPPSSLPTINQDIVMDGTATEEALYTNHDVPPAANGGFGTFDPSDSTPEARPTTQPRSRSSPLNQDITRQFKEGEGSTWAPSTLHSEVLRLLWEPIPSPTSKGSIYAVEVIGTPYVKIGVTTRRVQTRLNEINGRHGQRLNIVGRRVEHDIPFLQLYRLEALVHADLAFYQRNLVIREHTQRRTHREYFEIDIATAQKTIRTWWSIMQTIGLEPGTEIDQTIKEAVRESVHKTEIQRVVAHQTEREQWRTVNADDEERVNMWRTAFKLDEGGFKKTRVERTVWRLAFAAMVLCFLYSLQVPPWVKDTVALLLLTAGVLYTMDTQSSDGWITNMANTSGALWRFVASLNRFTELTM
jgi:hypothetical protein